MGSSNEQIVYRVATRADLQGAVELLEENYRGSLSEEGKKDGFISVLFSVDDLIEMSENGVTVVAVCGDTTAGVLSAQSCDYNVRKIPLVKEMVTALTDKIVDGAPIDTTQSIVCGPVCVSKEFRGQGVFEKMYDVLKGEAKKNYSLGLTLISQGNPRSLRAHEKIGMQKVTSFDFDGRTFDALAMWFV